MLLGHHTSWTNNALDAVDINADQKEEIRIGCTVNDLCEITNETYPFILPQQILSSVITANTVYESKDDIYQSFGTMPFLFSNLAIFQSHFGSLASLHAMAKKNQEAPDVTQKEISSWFDFFNILAVGSLAINPQARIYQDNAALRSLFFRCRKIEYRQLFDTENYLEIKSRAVGMMCHLIQDLFTFSHCERNSKNEIRKFFYYELQDKEKHKQGDHVAAGLDQELLTQCKLCIENTARNIPYDYKQILILSQDAQPSDGGNFT